MSMFDPLKIFDPGGSDVFGSKPVIPEAVDYAKVLSDAASSNIQLLPKLAKLSELSTAEYMKRLEQALPGFADMLKTGTSAIQSQLHGEIPDDVARQVAQRSAERSRMGGYGDSGFAGNLTARDLGLTSLDITNQALGSANRWMASAKDRTFDFSRMFLSPEMAVAGAESKFQRDLLAAGVEAAPDPVARGRYDTELAILGMVLSIYSGGQGYTGQYRPQTNYSKYGGGDSYGGGGSRSYFGSGASEGGGDVGQPFQQTNTYNDYGGGYQRGNSFDAVDTAMFAGFV